MTTDPRFLPARVLAQSQRDPAEGITGAPPGFGQEWLPHIYTVNGRRGVVSQSYHNYDETALLNWHVEAEDQTNRDEVAKVAVLNDILAATARFT